MKIFKMTLNNNEKIDIKTEKLEVENDSLLGKCIVIKRGDKISKGKYSETRLIPVANIASMLIDDVGFKVQAQNERKKMIEKDEQ